ncbi:hypothetical protein N7451_006255 [Penicillium sp. IBT 35674x]|nr:hypothetical protein N7451_006255 [Penicillium sp. IBT 35674x]
MEFQTVVVPVATVDGIIKVFTAATVSDLLPSSPELFPSSVNILLTKINKDRKATDTDPPLFIQQEINRQMASQQAPQQEPQQASRQAMQQLQPQPQHQPMTPAIPYDGRYYTSPLDDAGVIQSYDLSLVQRALESCHTIAERLKDDKKYLAKHLRDNGEPEVKDGEDTVIDSFAVRLRAPRNPKSGRFYDEKWLTSPWDDSMVCNLFDFPAHRRALLVCNAIIQRAEDDERRLRLRLEKMGELYDWN